MTTIAIDLGGSRIKIGLVADGKVLKSTMLDANSGHGLQNRLTTIEDTIRRLLTKEEIEDTKGIGIAYPGLVNWKEKRVIQGNGKYTDAPSVDLEKWAKDVFQLPMIMENDANAALLGELYYGCGHGAEDAVMLILGTGVGTAAVMGGQLIRGKHNQAGCLGGHFPTEINGRPCTCPGRGCIEANASTWTLPRLIKEHKDYMQSGLCEEKMIDFKTLKEYVLIQDKVAVDTLDYCTKTWANCIISLIYAYDPEVILLSGGVIKFGSILLEPMLEYVKKNVWTPWGKVEFRIAENTEHSVLLGLHWLLNKS